MPLRKENFSDSSTEELEVIRTLFLQPYHSKIIPLRGAENLQTEEKELKTTPRITTDIEMSPEKVNGPISTNAGSENEQISSGEHHFFVVNILQFFMPPFPPSFSFFYIFWLILF